MLVAGTTVGRTDEISSQQLEISDEAGVAMAATDLPLRTSGTQRRAIVNTRMQDCGIEGRMELQRTNLVLVVVNADQ